jgi:hypothetical protein
MSSRYDFDFDLAAFFFREKACGRHGTLVHRFLFDSQ